MRGSRLGLALATTALAVGVTAVVVTRGADPAPLPRPSIALVGWDVADAGVNVRPRITNWKLYSEMGRVFPDGGHWHVLVDGAPAGGSATGLSDHVEGLGPGRHRLYVELFNNDDTPLTPPARSRTVTVEIPKEEQ